MRILGISAFHRDAAAALLVDGEVVAAAQEERYSKKRLDPAFPRRAMRAVLDAGGVHGPDLDAVVFYERPLRKFERLLVSQLRGFPRSTSPFAKIMFLWLGDRLWLKDRLASETGAGAGKVRFVSHQMTHAALARAVCPAAEAAVLTVDDGGEWSTTLLAEARGAVVTPLAEQHLPHSLGLFAAALTQFLGFDPGADATQVECLAARGEPRFADTLRGLFRDKGEGAFELDLTPFRFAFDPERLFDERLEALLGPARAPGSPLRIEGADTRDADLAASLQVVCEERVLAMASALHQRAPHADLCFGGALAANTRVCARLAEEGPFERLHVPAAPEDAGAALGAALAYAALAGETVELGPAFLRPDLGEGLDERAEAGAVELGSLDATRAEIVERLGAGELVGWAQGRMDLAPESLGSRSALAHPGAPDARARLTRALQRPEPWQPVSVLLRAEDGEAHLELPPGAAGPAQVGRIAVRAKAALEDTGAVEPDGRVRVQLLSADALPQLHELLGELAVAGHAPLLLATSLRARGAPLPRNELDLVDVYERSELDALYAGTRLYARASAAGPGGDG